MKYVYCLSQPLHSPDPCMSSGIIQRNVLGPAFLTVFLANSLLVFLDVRVSAFADDWKFLARLRKYIVGIVLLNINRVNDQL